MVESKEVASTVKRDYGVPQYRLCLVHDGAQLVTDDYLGKNLVTQLLRDVVITLMVLVRIRPAFQAR